MQYDKELKQQQEALLVRLLKQFAPEKQALDQQAKQLLQEIEEKKRQRAVLRAEVNNLATKSREIEKDINKERGAASVEAQRAEKHLALV